MKYIIAILLLLNTHIYAQECVHQSSKPSIFYIDDIGEISGGLSAITATDPNGIQDLVAVLGLRKHVNILGIGVSIPAKRISYTAARPNDVLIAKKISDATSKPIGVYSGTAMLDKIIELAECSSSTNRLQIVIGSPWFDLENLLARDSSIASKIKIIGTGGSNLTNSIHINGSRPFNVVRDAVGSNNIRIINGAFWLDTTNVLDVNYMNAYYVANLQPVLSQVTDSEGFSLSSSKYLIATSRINNAPQLGGHVLRFGDVSALATLIIDNGRLDCDITFPVEDQLCMLDFFAEGFDIASNGIDISFMIPIINLILE